MYSRYKQDIGAIDWPRIFLLASFFLLLFVNGRTFSLWYYGEDYLWLFYTSNISFSEALRPVAGTFYRPLSTNLPFYVFSRMEQGRFIWKCLSFVCMGASCYWFWSWTKNVSRNGWVALLLTVAWMFNPAQSYGIHYLVSFNYVLAPTLMIGIFFFLQRKSFWRAILCLFLGLLTKEFFLAAPLVFVLWRSRYSIPSKFLFFSAALCAISLLFRGGISLGQKRMGNYLFLSDVSGIADHFRYLAGKMFLGDTGFPNVDAWYVYGWAIPAVFVAVALLSERGRREMGGVWLHLVALVVFFVPVALVQGLLSEDLGPFYWIFIFGAAAEAWGAIPWRIPAVSLPAIAGCLGFCTYAVFADDFRVRYIELEKKYFQIMQRTIPLLSVCGEFDQIVTSGLEDILKSELYAEFAVRGLQHYQPGTRFYLLKSGKELWLKGVEKNSILWVDDQQAAGHPFLAFSLDEEEAIRVSWKGGARCRTSVEQFRYRGPNFSVGNLY